MKTPKICNHLKECDSRHCELKQYELTLPKPKLAKRTIILCPYVEKTQKNPFTANEQTQYNLTKLDGVLHVCPAIRCPERRGIYCLDPTQLEKIKQMEEKEKE
jgi:uncharacterized protein YcbK (DUF882 family)